MQGNQSKSDANAEKSFFSPELKAGLSTTITGG